MSLFCLPFSRQILTRLLQDTTGVNIQRSTTSRNLNTRNFNSTSSSHFRLSLQRQHGLAAEPLPLSSDDFYVPFASATPPSSSPAPAISALPPAFRPPSPPPSQDTDYEPDTEPDIQLLGDIDDAHATPEQSVADSYPLDDQSLHDNGWAAEAEEIYESTAIGKNATPEIVLGTAVGRLYPVTTTDRPAKERNVSQIGNGSQGSWKQRQSRGEAPAIDINTLSNVQTSSLETNKHSLKSSKEHPISPFNQITKGLATEPRQLWKQRRYDLGEHGDRIPGNKLVSTSNSRADTKSEPRRKRRETSDNRRHSGGLVPSNKFVPTPKTIAKTKLEPWQTQKYLLKEKFGDSGGWNPRKRLSPDALEGIRALHAQYPDRFTTPVLADQFKVSPEAIRRILKSKWRPNAEEEEERRARWDKRGERIWTSLVEQGVHPPKKWRQMGIGGGPRRPAQDRSLRGKEEEWDEERRLKEEAKRDGNAWVTSLARRIL